MVLHGVPGAYARGFAETGPSGLVRVFLGCCDEVLTHVALLKPALQAWWGPQGLVLLVRLARVCDSSLKRRFPVAQGAAIVMTPFAGGMVQMNVSRNRPPRGQRPGTTWPRASPEGLGAELPNLFLYSQPMHSTITGF